MESNTGERNKLFHTLFEENFLYVCACLRRFGVRPNDVEDAAHEVFLTVYRRLDTFDETGSPRPWLARIAYLTALSSRQRMCNQRELLAPSTMPDPADGRPAPDKLLELEQDRMLVLDALQTLSPERCVVLTMHDIDGHSIPDVARVLSIPVNTAYSRLRLARVDFRNAIQRVSRGALPLSWLRFVKG